MHLKMGSREVINPGVLEQQSLILDKRASAEISPSPASSRLRHLGHKQP